MLHPYQSDPLAPEKFFDPVLNCVMYLYPVNITYSHHRKTEPITFTNYYFSKVRKAGFLTELPDGYEIMHVPMNNLPFLRKIKK